jgi:hypothetical protein
MLRQGDAQRADFMSIVDAAHTWCPQWKMCGRTKAASKKVVVNQTLIKENLGDCDRLRPGNATYVPSCATEPSSNLSPRVGLE